MHCWPDRWSGATEASGVRQATEEIVMAQVAVMQTQDRSAGVRGAVLALGRNPVKNKDVLIKPNFNTADPVPGSTHNDTLVALVDTIWQMGARSVSL
jgi:uncharacterized protein (DUF362 family)